MRRLMLLSAVLLIGFAPAPFPKPGRHSKAPGSEILGLWKGPHELQITADRMNYHPGPGVFEYAMRLDTNRRPYAFDLQGVQGGRVMGRSSRGIWKVEGDTLTICYNAGTGQRPTAFEGPGKGTFTEVYKRQSR